MKNPKFGRTQINGQDFDILEVYDEEFKGLANNYLGYNGNGMHFPTNTMEIAVQEIKTVADGRIQ